MSTENVTAYGRMEGAAGCPVLTGYDPLEQAELDDPFPSFARARAQAPVSFNEKYGFYDVAGREEVLAVLRDNERFSNRMAIPMPLPPEELRDRMPVYPTATALTFLDDPAHRSARQMVQSPFVPRRLRAMEPVVRRRATELLRLEDPDRELEFVHDYAIPLALNIIGTILGVPPRDFALLERATTGAFRLASVTLTEDEVMDLALEQLEYWDYLKALVEERRQAPRDDFVSVLAAARDEAGDHPSPDVVAGHINTILGAGFETTSQLMATSVLSLLQHPDQWELLKADRSLLPQAVEESMRYRTIIKRHFRIATTDVQVGGVTIPEGALVAILYASANRDESVFPDPDRFDITRRADNVVFGRGMHYCLGAPLSKLEMKVTLDTLADLAPDVRLLEHEPLDRRPDIRIDVLHHLRVDLGPVPQHRP